MEISNFVQTIKNNFPKSWAKFINWYAAWAVEQEGYIEELFDILFTTENMRILYTFFDEESRYVATISYIFSEGNKPEWFGQVNYKDCNEFYSMTPSSDRLTAEIDLFTHLFNRMEKDNEA